MNILYVANLKTFHQSQPQKGLERLKMANAASEEA